METKNYRTNIKCEGCIAKVTPVLNQLAGTNNWKVDIDSPEKKLTLLNPGVKENELMDQLKKLGYGAEPMD